MEIAADRILLAGIEPAAGVPQLAFMKGEVPMHLKSTDHRPNGQPLPAQMFTPPPPPPPRFFRGRAGAAAMTGTGRRRFPVLIAAIAALAVAGTVLGMLVSPVQAQERDEVLQSVSEGDTDLPNDNSTSGRVAVGRSATGDIGIPKDQDRFAVDLEAGRTYRFDLTGRPGGGGTLRDTYFRAIYNSEGRYQSGSYNDDFDGGRDSRVTFTPTESGTYYARVSGDRNETGTYTLSVTDVTAEQGAGPPAKPRGLEATATHGRVVLTWDDPDDDSITGYIILRRVRVNDTGGDFSELVANTGSAATTYTDNTVAAGLTYTYRIKAINGAGTSERSRWFHIDTPPAPAPEEEQAAEPPAKPTGLEATASHDSVTLTWDDPQDDSITGYVILRRIPGVDPQGHFNELVSDTGTDATTYTDDTVSAETRYTYRIKAINEHGVSERSRWFHIDTPAAPEAAEGDEQDGEDDPVGAPGHATPSGPGGTDKLVELRDVPPARQGFEASNGNEQVTLTWDAPDADADITRHEYRFKTTGDYPSEWTEIDDSAPGEAHEDWVVVTGLTNDTAYTFQLRAANTDGAGAAAEAGPATPRSGVCGRTEQVRDAIVAAIAGVSDCADVTPAQLAGVEGGLNLANKDIRSLQPGDFSDLEALTNLWLGNNALVSLPAGVFSDLMALETLYLNSNEFSSLPAGAFTDLEALKDLSLNHNALSSLPAGVFTGLEALTNLSLNHNALSSLPAGVFSDLEALEDLYLNENELSSLPTDGFTDLSALDRLYLDHNKLSSLPADVFTGLTSLTYLGLHDNELVSLPADVFTGLTSLTYLGLHDNELVSLPADVFTGLTSLDSLWLTDNALVSLPADVFSGLTSLELLHLRNNKLSSLPADVFSGLTSLKLLNLGENELVSLPADVFSGLEALELLSLSRNALVSLPADVFSGLEALELLYLYSNQFSELPAGVFSGLEALELLRLYDNDLTSLPDGVFSGLTALTDLKLGDNPNTDKLLPLSVTLENVGSDKVRAKVLAGAPFTVDIPVTVANGALDGDVTALTVEAGSVEGTAVTVTPTGTPVTVDIDLTTQPSLPENHDGYIFVVEGADLPANATTSGVVEVDGSGARGAIAEPRAVRDDEGEITGYTFDTDWFRVELKAGRTYRIDMKGQILSSPGLDIPGEPVDAELTLSLPQINAIYDAGGDYLLNTWGADESSAHHLFRVTFHAHAGGTYYIAASGESFEWGGYELRVIDITPASKPAVADGPPGLAPNVPNPFNPSTVIPYRLDTDGPVRLVIYNLLGQRIRALVDEAQAAGAYRVQWDARDAAGRRVSSGVYFIRLRYPGGVQTRRMLYLE